MAASDRRKGIHSKTKSENVNFLKARENGLFIQRVSYFSQMNETNSRLKRIYMIPPFNIKNRRPFNGRLFCCLKD